MLFTILLIYDSWLAVFTYNINKNDVGMIINKAVAINPRIFTSIMNPLNIICSEATNEVSCK